MERSRSIPQAGDKERISEQIEYIDEIANQPDMILLNEVTTLQRDYWYDQLTNIGYDEITDTLDWTLELRESNVPHYQDFGKVIDNLIAVHKNSELQNLERKTPSIREDPFGNSVLKHWDTNFPEKF